jgi:hypothetical protein
MESATISRRAPGTGLSGRVRAVDVPTVAKVAFVLLCVACAIGIVVFPTYPNYDSYYALLWGRELLHGVMPDFQGFRAPTEHPLAIAAGAVLSLFGRGADRLWIALTFASFMALIWGMYRLARISFTPLVGLIAAALLLTRFDFGFLAARGYIDIPYMALVVWAAALEAARPRRGTAVFVLLALAGMLRPEAWVLTGLYFLWVAWKATWPERFKFAALAAIGPLVWAGTDLIVTGDPAFSLTYTSSSAEELGRQRTLSQLPSAVPQFFTNIVKTPVLIASLLGLVIGVSLSPRDAAMPLGLLAAGLATFLMIGIAGLSVIERYLIVPALALIVFAAVTFGGFSMLRPGALVRRLWMLGALALVLYGVLFTVTRVNLSSFRNELQFRGDAHQALDQVLNDPAVRAGLRCGPLTLPNHKLVPDSRWVAGLPFEKVEARADPKVGTNPGRGVHVYVSSRFAILKHAWTNKDDPADIQVPPAGAARVAANAYYSAYVRC